MTSPLRHRTWCRSVTAWSASSPQHPACTRAKCRAKERFGGAAPGAAPPNGSSQRVEDCAGLGEQVCLCLFTQGVRPLGVLQMADGPFNGADRRRSEERRGGEVGG